MCVTANDGVSDSAVNVHKGAPVALTAPSKTGYRFKSWATRSGEEGNYRYTDYDTNGPTNTDLALFAQWEAVSYAIAYDLGGGTNAVGNPASYTVESETITLAAPERAGYEFKGWVNAQNEPVTKIEKGSTGDVAVKATWQAVSYTIAYDLGGGTNASGNPASYTVESETITLAAPERAGYEFKGWVNAQNEPIAKIEKGSTGNVTVRATWQVISYTISYELNEGTLEGENPTAYTVESETIALASPERAGYEFKGWYPDAEFAGEAVTEIAKGTTGNLSLYAKWEKKSGANVGLIVGLSVGGVVVAGAAAGLVVFLLKRKKR